MEKSRGEAEGGGARAVARRAPVEVGLVAEGGVEGAAAAQRHVVLEEGVVRLEVAFRHDACRPRSV